MCRSGMVLKQSLNVLTCISLDKATSMVRSEPRSLHWLAHFFQANHKTSNTQGFQWRGHPGGPSLSCTHRWRWRTPWCWRWTGCGQFRTRRQSSEDRKCCESPGKRPARWQLCPHSWPFGSETSPSMQPGDRGHDQQLHLFQNHFFSETFHSSRQVTEPLFRTAFSETFPLRSPGIGSFPIRSPGNIRFPLNSPGNRTFSSSHQVTCFPLKSLGNRTRFSETFPLRSPGNGTFPFTSPGNRTFPLDSPGNRPPPQVTR